LVSVERTNCDEQIATKCFFLKPRLSADFRGKPSIRIAGIAAAKERQSRNGSKEACVAEDQFWRLVAKPNAGWFTTGNDGVQSCNLKEFSEHIPCRVTHEGDGNVNKL
jgi:hypothetical protein